VKNGMMMLLKKMKSLILNKKPVIQILIMLNLKNQNLLEVVVKKKVFWIKDRIS
jgi:flagellar basal body-associated protein FliL